MNNTIQNFDILIAGGGLVGHCLALALAPYPLKIGIIEKMPAQVQTQFDYDARSLALSFGSRQIFEKWSAWEKLAPLTTPIHQVHVSDKGNFGFTRIDAKKLKVDALGYIIEMHSLLDGVMQAQAHYQTISKICPADIIQAEQKNRTWHVIVKEEGQTKEYTTPLLVAADGGNSSLRQALRIELTQRDYEQQAIITNIGLLENHHNKAFERFTKAGPIALLPMSEKRSALVWTVKKDEVSSYLNLTDEEFLNQLQNYFGYRLGKFVKVGKRFTYPLKAIYAKQQIKPGFVLLGNSAHTLHPVAGQGFNLCLRDIAVLAQILTQAWQQDINLATYSLLENYYNQRKTDQKQIFHYSDKLVRIFSNDFMPVTYLRNLGLIVCDLIPFCKNYLARFNMGIN